MRGTNSTVVMLKRKQNMMWTGPVAGVVVSLAEILWITTIPAGSGVSTATVVLGVAEAVDLRTAENLSFLGVAVYIIPAGALGLVVVAAMRARPISDRRSCPGLARSLWERSTARRSWRLEQFADPRNGGDNFVKKLTRRVSDIIARNVILAPEDTAVGENAQMFERHRIRWLFVVRDGQIVGIVSRGNLLHSLAHMNADALSQSSATDEELRRAVQAVLAKVSGAIVNLVNLRVENGQVSLWVVADSDFGENGLRLAAEFILGCRDVDININTGRMPS